MSKLLKPVSNPKIVSVDEIFSNDYNPNVINEQNLELLVQSILTNGWTLPIVVNSDYVIVDGFHRWMVAKREPLYSKLEGKIPVVIVDHPSSDDSKNIYGTITHNRARGTHLLEPMKNIISRLFKEGKTVKEISKQLGMKEEEVFRLSDFTRDDFLKMMGAKDGQHSKAKLVFDL